MKNCITIKGRNHYLCSNIEEITSSIGFEPEIKENWRLGNTGDWVSTDDGMFCEILARGKLTRPSGKVDEYVRTVCGSHMCNPKKEMYGVIAENIYTFSGTNEYRRFMQKTSANSKEYLFAQYVASGVEPIDAYLKTYSTENKRYAANQANRLLQTERVQTMVKEEIQSALEEEGISHNYLIKRFKEVVDNGERDGDVLRSLESLSKISGLMDSQESESKQQLTVWSGFSPEQLKSVEGEIPLLTAEKDDG
jgi:hypothetical protein|tara:strand:- start:631 stop:1383 length:753 start_codon:yes stop_codon:yes gene_type:complete